MVEGYGNDSGGGSWEVSIGLSLIKRPRWEGPTDTDHKHVGEKHVQALNWPQIETIDAQEHKDQSKALPTLYLVQVVPELLASIAYIMWWAQKKGLPLELVSQEIPNIGNFDTVPGTSTGWPTIPEELL